MVYYIALCNTTQYLYLCVFVCVCLYCLRVSLFLWVFECLSVCLCLCVYLQRLTARDLSSSRRGQYPSHHPLCLFFSKRNFRFAFLFLMCTFLFFSSNKSNLDVLSNMFPIWQSRKRIFFVQRFLWHFLGLFWVSFPPKDNFMVSCWEFYKICSLQNLQLFAVNNIKLNSLLVTDGDVIYLRLQSGVLWSHVDGGLTIFATLKFAWQKNMKIAFK